MDGPPHRWQASGWSICPRCFHPVAREPDGLWSYIISGTDFCPRCGYEFESGGGT